MSCLQLYFSIICLLALQVLFYGLAAKLLLFFIRTCCQVDDALAACCCNAAYDRVELL
jgi:hypothetical protein